MTQPQNDPNLVPIPIEGQLAELALRLAAEFKQLPIAELLKLQEEFRATERALAVKPRQVSSKRLMKLCSLIGFTFAMNLDAAREKRLAEREAGNEGHV